MLRVTCPNTFTAILALEWALSQSCISTTLVSITSEQQLEENINVLKRTIEVRQFQPQSGGSQFLECFMRSRKVTRKV